MVLPIVDAMPTYFVPKAFSGHDKVARWAVDWMTANLGPEHCVFVEFTIPGGRQIDFLILTNTGIYCIEVKDKPYHDIRINGPWQFADRATGRIFNDPNSPGENPYQQATNSADSLKRWISKELSRVFSTRKQKPQLDEHGVIEGLKVFPAVLIPKPAKHPKQERDIWCRIYVGVEELRQFSERTWLNFTLSADEIMRIAGLLSLERISPAELRRPELSRHFQYCGDLMQEMDSPERLLDYYVPNDLEANLHEKQALSSQLPRNVSDLLPLLSDGARYFITAPGGYGKTTLCAYLCRIKAKERIEDPQNPLPIFLQLRYYRSQDGGLDRLLSDALVPRAFPTILELQKELRSGACVLFLDGLNEVPEAERDDIFKDLIRLSRANSKLAIVVTSRDLDTPEGFAPHFSGLRLKPFSPVQIQTYLASRAPDHRSSLEG